ncbi:hypothetical protein WMY93_034408, partial [Mugilogobius chulae]
VELTGSSVFDYIHPGGPRGDGRTVGDEASSGPWTFSSDERSRRCRRSSASSSSHSDSPEP